MWWTVEEGTAFCLQWPCAANPSLRGGANAFRNGFGSGSNLAVLPLLKFFSGGQN